VRPHGSRWCARALIRNSSWQGWGESSRSWSHRYRRGPWRGSSSPGRVMNLWGTTGAAGSFLQAQSLGGRVREPAQQTPRQQLYLQTLAPLTRMTSPLHSRCSRQSFNNSTEWPTPERCCRPRLVRGWCCGGGLSPCWLLQVKQTHLNNHIQNNEIPMRKSPSRGLQNIDSDPCPHVVMLDSYVHDPMSPMTSFDQLWTQATLLRGSLLQKVPFYPRDRTRMFNLEKPESDETGTKVCIMCMTGYGPRTPLQRLFPRSRRAGQF
jgi:hypothetical protein